MTLAVDALDEFKESGEGLFDSLRGLTANNGPYIFATSLKKTRHLGCFRQFTYYIAQQCKGSCRTGLKTDETFG